MAFPRISYPRKRLSGKIRTSAFMFVFIFQEQLVYIHTVVFPGKSSCGLSEKKFFEENVFQGKRLSKKTSFKAKVFPGKRFIKKTFFREMVFQGNSLINVFWDKRFLGKTAVPTYTLSSHASALRRF